MCGLAGLPITARCLLFRDRLNPVLERMPPASKEHPSSPGRPGRAVRVVLSDDECMFRASLRQLLSVPPPVIKDVYGVDVGTGFQVVGEAGSGEETVSV